MASEIRRRSPVQDIGKLPHSEGDPRVKVKAVTGPGKTKERATKDERKLKRTNMGKGGVQ